MICWRSYYVDYILEFYKPGWGSTIINEIFHEIPMENQRIFCINIGG